MAGVEGIEPPSAVLETAVLPLYDAPKTGPQGRTGRLFGFLVQSFLFAEFAELLELQALLGVLLVFLGLVVKVVADRALHVYQMVLGHLD